MKLNIFLALALLFAGLALASEGVVAAQEPSRQPDVYERAETEADRLQELPQYPAQLRCLPAC